MQSNAKVNLQFTLFMHWRGYIKGAICLEVLLKLLTMVDSI